MKREKRERGTQELVLDFPLTLEKLRFGNRCVTWLWTSSLLVKKEKDEACSLRLFNVTERKSSYMSVP